MNKKRINIKCTFNLSKITEEQKLVSEMFLVSESEVSSAARDVAKISKKFQMINIWCFFMIKYFSTKIFRYYRKK